jgi:hypothetical protein
MDPTLKFSMLLILLGLGTYPQNSVPMLLLFYLLLRISFFGCNWLFLLILFRSAFVFLFFFLFWVSFLTCFFASEDHEVVISFVTLIDF